MILTLDPEQAEIVADALTAHVARIVTKLNHPKVRGGAMLERERRVVLGLLRDIREMGDKL